MEEGGNFFTIKKTQRILQIPIILEDTTMVKIASPGEQFIFSKIDESNVGSYSITATSGVHKTSQPTIVTNTNTTSVYTNVRCSTSTETTQQTFLPDQRRASLYQTACTCSSCMLFQPRPFVRPFVTPVSTASMSPKPVFVDSIVGKGKTTVGLTKKPAKRSLPEEGMRGGTGGGRGGGAKELRLRPDLTRVSNVDRGAKDVETMRTPPECLIKEECYSITVE